MNYKFETIMTWIMYIKNGIWEVEKRNDYADDPEVIQSKFEDLFENELYISEIVKDQILEGLQPSELASVICALVTEEQNNNSDMPSLPISRNVRAALNRIKEVKRRIFLLQRDYDITKDMYLNSCYSPLVELWILETPWEDVVAQGGVNEGDLVRTFKRTVDILRQLTLLSAASEELKMTAKSAIKSILKEPVDMD